MKKLFFLWIGGHDIVNKNLEAKIVINNLADKQYFTKRPSFYPGPGIWPSDGRSINLSIGIHL